MLTILYRFSRLLQDSLWRRVICWSEHAWLLLACGRSVEDLLVVRRLLLLPSIVMHHRAAECWTVQRLGCRTHAVLEGRRVLSRDWHVVLHRFVRSITECAENTESASGGLVASAHIIERTSWTWLNRLATGSTEDTISVHVRRVLLRCSECAEAVRRLSWWLRRSEQFLSSRFGCKALMSKCCRSRPRFSKRTQSARTQVPCSATVSFPHA